MTAQKIRIYPKKSQQQTLNKWFGLQRWVYNKCLAQHKENIRNEIKTTVGSLRTNIINNSNFENSNTWVLDYNYDLRDEAIRDFIKNLKSNKAKGGKFELKFRSLKDQKLYGCSMSVLKKK